MLIAILICAFGLLGFAGMQARATSSEFEAFQRSEALVLVEDMVSRINANRAHAGDYVSGGPARRRRRRRLHGPDRCRASISANGRT